MARGSQPGEHRGGRKKGTPNKRTQALQAAVEKSGATPLEVMLGAMRYFWRKARYDGDTERAELDVALLKEAVTHAEKAAQYVHPKLSTQEVGGIKGGSAIPLDVAAKVTVVLPDNGRRNA